MTSKEEITSPVVTHLFSNGVTSVGAISEEALAALELKSQPTPWALTYGRPILDRLPAASQQYQKGYDSDQAYVYLDSKTNLAVGPGTLQVVRDQYKGNILFVNDGEITWNKGQIKTDSLTVDVSALNFERGLDDGAYQVGYTLGNSDTSEYSLVPGFARANLVDSLLGDTAINYSASSATQYYNTFQALTEEDVTGSTAWRPNVTYEAGPYEYGSWYVLDFKAEVEAKEFELSSDLADPTATMAVYYSEDGILWEKVIEVKPNSSGWKAELPQRGRYRYWRFYFWDGTVSVSEIKYTGEAYVPDLRASSTSLNATPFLDGLYEEIEGDYISLATFEVKRSVITNIVDTRKVTNIKYEPVADWLTDFQDSSLKCLFNLVENYSGQCLNPTTANFHYYNELDDSTCFGEGKFTLSSEAEVEIDFPYLLEFSCTLGSTIPCGIIPNQVINLKDPVVDSDLATKSYTDLTLFVDSLDNGIYN